MTEIETKQIVKVKYYITEDELSATEYSYYTDIPLNVGDIVTVPVRDKTARAQVSVVNVPESEVAAFKDRLKTILAPTIKAAKESISGEVSEETEEERLGNDPFAEYPPEAFKELHELAPECKPGDDWREIKPLGPLTDTRTEAEKRADAGPEPAFIPDDSEIVNVHTGMAVIKVEPGQDEIVIALHQQSQSLLSYAQSREILSNTDLTSATEDLSLIAKLKKAIEDKRKEYVNPIREKLDKVNAAFKEFTGPLEQADGITRGKIMYFRKEQERKRAEIEEIERQKMELARREAELNHGETTVDLTPIEKPAPVPDTVRTDVGNAGTMKVRKWEVEDISKVPAEYLSVDTVRIGKVVRAGIPSIPGIRIWEEKTLRVNTR